MVGDYDITKLLLEEMRKRPDPDAWRFSKDSLLYASRFGRMALVELLLDESKHLGQTFTGFELENALREAIISNHSDLVTFLLSKGASVHNETNAGTPLHVAAHFGHTQLVDLFLHRGANPRKIGVAHCSALFFACCRNNEGAVADGKGPKPSQYYDEQYRYGTTLQAAAYNGFLDTVQLLIQNNVQINRRAGRYGTALQAACAQGHESIARLC